VRGKPRDLYDIWLLLGQGVRPDRALIERKLALYGLTFNVEALDAALARVRAGWERDLRPLLPQFVAYEDVVREEILDKVIAEHPVALAEWTG